MKFKINQRQFFIALAAFAAVSCGPREIDNSVTISGRIDGLEFKGRYTSKDTLFLDFNNIRGERIRDTILIVDGELNFKKELEIDAISRGRIFMPMDTVTKWIFDGYYPTAVSRIDFLMYPGAEIVINGSIKDYVDAYGYDGGINDELVELTKETHVLENEAMNLQVRIAKSEYYRSEYYEELSEQEIDSLETLRKIVRLDPDLIKDMTEKMNSLNDQVFALKKEFGSDHSQSAIAAYVLQDISRDLDYDTFSELFKNLAEDVKSNPYGMVLDTKLQATEATKVGNPAPLIVGTTHLGESFDLTQLQGKVVLIDFWGTWCGPCIDGFPKLKEFYSKYDDLEILGIASDQEQAWRKGIDKFELTWIQLLDAKGDVAINNYNVNAFPTKFIIDRDGKIALKGIGEIRESEIEEVLAKLMGD